MYEDQASKSTRNPEVMQSITSLEKQIESLNVFIDDLENRLSQVIHPRAQCAAESKKGTTPEGVLLANTINSLTHKVSDATARLCSIIDRIEL